MRTLNVRLLGAAVIAVAVLTPTYAFVRQVLGYDVHFRAVLFCTAVLAAIILSGYQIFFLEQSVSNRRRASILSSPLDKAIPFWPAAVWIYSGLYYGLIGLPIAFTSGDRDCLMFIAGGIGLFFVVTASHVAIPTRCPSEWRTYTVKSLSTRFLAAVQYYDIGLSCFPSLHCAFAAYAAASVPSAPVAALIVMAVSLSCLLVKQHSILEVPPSLLIGWGWWHLAHNFIR